MSNNRHYPRARAILNAMVILGLVIATGASTLTAYAAPMTNNLIAAAIAITTANYTGIVDDVVPATTSAADPVITCGASQGQGLGLVHLHPPQFGCGQRQYPQQPVRYHPCHLP